MVQGRMRAGGLGILCEQSWIKEHGPKETDELCGVVEAYEYVSLSVRPSNFRHIQPSAQNAPTRFMLQYHRR